MVLVADAVGVCKVGVRKAQLFYPRIHLCHAVRDGALSHIFGQQVGAVVGAGHLGGIQRIRQGDFFALAQGNVTGIGACQRVNILVGHGELYIIPVPLRLFAGKAQRHHLGDGCRVQLFVHILLCQHKAGVCIDDAVSAGGTKGRASRRCPWHKHTEHKQHSTQRCGQFFHLVFLH